MRCIVIALAIAFCLDGLVTAQDSGLTRSVDHELLLLGSFVELDAGVPQKIREDLREVIRKESDDQNSTFFLFGHVPASVYDVLLDAISQRVSESEGLNLYLADLSTRRTIRRKMSADAVVLVVERAVGVRQDQWDRLVEEVAGLVKKDLLPPPYSLEGWKPDKVAMAAFTRVLSERQLRSLKTNLGLTRRDTFAGSMFDGANEPRSVKLKAELKSLADAQILWLEYELKLSLSQVQRLKLAAKGALQSVLSDRIAAENKLGGELKTGRMDPSNAQTKLAMVDQARLLTRHSRWRNLVLSSLDDNQKARFLEIEKSRAAIERKGDLDHLFVSLSRKMALNANQVKRLRDLIDRKAPPLQPGEWATWFDSWVNVASVGQAGLVAAVGEDNAALAADEFARIRTLVDSKAADGDEEPAR